MKDPQTNHKEEHLLLWEHHNKADRPSPLKHNPSPQHQSAWPFLYLLPSIRILSEPREYDFSYTHVCSLLGPRVLVVASSLSLTCNAKLMTNARPTSLEARRKGTAQSRKFQICRFDVVSCNPISNFIGTLSSTAVSRFRIPDRSQIQTIWSTRYLRMLESA